MYHCVLREEPLAGPAALRLSGCALYDLSPALHHLPAHLLLFELGLLATGLCVSCAKAFGSADVPASLLEHSLPAEAKRWIRQMSGCPTPQITFIRT